MDTTTNSVDYFQNEWTIYLLSILLFVALFFIQKYSYLIDRKLSEKMHAVVKWEGKQWPFLSGLLVGFITFTLSVFLPGELTTNPVNWYWPEIFIFILILAIIVGIVIESFTHFGKTLGAVRTLIFGAITIVFFIAGLLAGLFIAAILALSIIIYFLFFWKKRLMIE